MVGEDVAEDFVGGDEALAGDAAELGDGHAEGLGDEIAGGAAEEGSAHFREITGGSGERFIVPLICDKGRIGIGDKPLLQLDQTFLEIFEPFAALGGDVE